MPMLMPTTIFLFIDIILSPQLMKVLSTKEFSHIIGWLPSGKSFVIHKPKVFTIQILPGHFKSAKYSSFTRKLHRWGFMRHYRGEEAGAFFHDDFQCGRLDLVEKMTCCKPGKPAAPTVRKAQQSTNETNAKTSSSSNSNVMPRSMSISASTQGRPVSAAVPMQITHALEGLSVYQRGAGAMESAMNNVHSGRASLDPSALNALRRQSMESRPDLNAAIEMEVSRRVKERMDVAAFNRLALMQQQAKLSRFPQVPLQQAQLPPSPFVPSWNQPGSNMSWNRTALALAAQSLYAAGGVNSNNAKPQQPQISYAAFGDLQTRASLPPTNIQGAKTA
jgi:HSF-type DNA-binding